MIFPDAITLLFLVGVFSETFILAELTANWITKRWMCERR